MAIEFVRVKHVSRSEGKNACCKSAYNSRDKVKFHGHDFSPAKTYNWSHKEKCAYSEILLPEHVDPSFKSKEVLWNTAEAKEKRKDSQVAMEFVLALPDDKCITLEDRMELAKQYAYENFVSKGLAVQIDIHPPDKKSHLSLESGEVIALEHNWHAHLLVTTRRFTKDGKELGEKARDLMPDVKSFQGKLYVENLRWAKNWTILQNKLFENKGLSLRVDPIGAISQIHLGPVRMRGRAYNLIEENNLRIELNESQAQNPTELLNTITKYKNVFTYEDLNSLLEKFVEEKLHADINTAFWKQKEIVPLLDQSGKQTGKFTTQEILAEEKRALSFADGIQKKDALKLESNFGQFSANLSPEQKDAYYKIVNGKRLSCIGGHAGTGKSHLLVALKQTYEAEGYNVRAFGPDTATSKVLEEKGFFLSENLHRFLFCLHNQKRQIKSGKEIWIIDEASKLGNKPMTQLLKVAKENNVQLIFSGDQSQMGAVERGSLYKVFCERYGSADLLEIRRQKRESDQNISKQIATGKISQAIDEISRTGGIIWDDTRKECIERLIKNWAADQLAFPGQGSLILANSQAERKVLNEMVRLYRKEKGEISTQEFECRTGDKKIYLSVGDLIEFSKNDKTLAVTNGMQGVLVEASPEKFVIAVKDGGQNRRITFNPAEYSSFQLGYATTYHRSQGKTVDRAYVLHSPRLNKESFYVGLTRHVQKAYLFVPKDNMHYLSYLKAKACGFENNYQTYLSEKSHFLGKSQDEYTQELKEQAAKSELKEGIEGYQTQRENTIAELKKSEELLSKLKGHTLSAWDKISGLIKGQKYAKKADYDFYHPEIKQEEAALVKEILPPPIYAFSQEDYDLIQAQFDKSPVINAVKAQQNLEKEPSLSTSSAPTKERLVNLPESHKKALKNYFEASEQASTWHALIKGEAENPKTSIHFHEWMKACQKRNELAYQLVRDIPSNELQSILGKRSLNIIWEKSHKHEQLLERESNQHLNIDAALKENLEPLLFKLFPEGPLRKDKQSYRFGSKGSLVIKVSGQERGAFYDHENQVGGGPLALIQKACKLSPVDAKIWAKTFLGEPGLIPPAIRVATRSSEKAEQWISCKPPAHVLAPSLKELNPGLDKHFQEGVRHPYYNEKGDLLFYVVRLVDKVDPQKKSFLHLSFGQNRGEEALKWALKGYQTDKKPLYNLPELLSNNKKLVLIVEGERTADAARQLFSKEEIICITWCGGASSVAKTDWSPLFERQVIIWPDNDTAGIKAGESICSELRRVGVKSLHMLGKDLLVKYFPEKWDVADPLPENMTSQQLKDLLFKASEKSIGIDQITLGLKEDREGNAIDKLKLNEILWRIEERLRPELEAKADGKNLQINQAIQEELLKIFNSEAKTEETLNRAGIKGEVAQRLTYQALLYQAETGKNLSQTGLENIKLNIRSIDINEFSRQYPNDLSMNENSRKDFFEYLVDKKLTATINQNAKEEKIQEDIQEVFREKSEISISKGMEY